MPQEIFKFAVRGATFGFSVLVVGCLAPPKVGSFPAQEPAINAPSAVPAPVETTSVAATLQKSKTDTPSVPVEEKHTWTSKSPSACPTPALKRERAAASAPSDSEVQSASRVVESMRGRFRHCRSALQMRNPEAEGTVRLDLQVDCEGHIIAIDAISRGLDSEAVACIFQIGDEVRFESPSGGFARVRIPVTFAK